MPTATKKVMRPKVGADVLERAATACRRLRGWRGHSYSLVVTRALELAAEMWEKELPDTDE